MNQHSFTDVGMGQVLRRRHLRCVCINGPVRRLMKIVVDKFVLWWWMLHEQMSCKLLYIDIIISLHNVANDVWLTEYNINLLMRADNDFLLTPCILKSVMISIFLFFCGL